MSSNTLRGVGQEGDGEGDRKGEGEQAPASGGVEPAAAAPTLSPTLSPLGASIAERMPELRKIRSLDATVPGTRSLDASVPEAQPSLDARVPSMAATMLGMTAQSIAARDGSRGGTASNPKRGEGSTRDAGDRVQGTVQGRDVHLPVEMQRRAGIISLPGGIPPARPEAAPQSVDYSEPTIADPVPVDRGGPNVISHGPWYEQEPLGAGDYDDAKPSVIGRVAIGAAVAASLAVVLFAIVRVRAQGAAQEAETSQSQPLPAPVAAPPPPAAAPIVPEELTAKAAEPVIDWGDPVPVPAPSRAAGATPARPAQEPSDSPAPTRSAQGSPAHASRSTSASPAATNSTTKKASANGASSLPPNLFRPKALGEPEPGRSASPFETSSPSTASAPTSPPPVEPAAPAAGSGTGASFPPAGIGSSGPSDDKATTDSPAKTTGKARGKKSDDPDSTLPLNLD